MLNGFAGIHHLALYTNDLDRTLGFYRDVLGLDVSAVSDSPRGRHAFVHLEPAHHGRPGLHFWENTELEQPDAGANLASFSSGPGNLAHVALYQPSTSAEAALRSRLAAREIAITTFEELGTFAFSDPNGIMVEIVPARHDDPQQTIEITEHDNGRGDQMPSGDGRQRSHSTDELDAAASS
jgi:catechol 2,3-dioxygenase-like lactoylglutathione lyase family enzyme